MHKRSFKRHLPTAQSLRENKALRPLEKWLNKPELWQFNRRSVSGAFFVGLFSAFLPVPSQMVAAAIFAVYARVNLPIATGLVWITNPLTIPPMFFFCYRLGAWLLDAEVKIDGIRLEWSWLVETYNSVAFTDVLFPLVFGCLVVGWTAGVSGFVIVRVAWRAQVIKRWQERRQLRRHKRAAGAGKRLTIS
ncbi:MAG: DUF2062 domain-containing protein [Pseudomonadota bacterium]